jgi:hypothetical protein
MKKTIEVTAFFEDDDPAADKLCRAIFEFHGGEFINSGTMLDGDLAPTCSRDIEYLVAYDKAAACMTALQKAGFRCEC